ncbi:cell wall-binding repeat-containing protein [Peptoniphilus duerdenii]|uniref:cell wall-binding repeat-containing protein n=1 Tax=Peptoniphilus duerdenii TaxID=507750 RepID=UPI00288B9C5C|nr:cell wall-binding repeat-containing protein [Peptoniphilus duerdenii]
MKRLIALLLAISMVFGTVSPAFAAGLSEKPDNKIEVDGSTENGVAKVKLVLPEIEKTSKKRSNFGASLFRARSAQSLNGKEAKFEETYVDLGVSFKWLDGLDAAEAFKGVFGNDQVNVTLSKTDGTDKQYFPINKDTTKIRFPKQVLQQDVVDGNYEVTVDLGSNQNTILLKMLQIEENPSGPVVDRETSAKLEIIQVRNSQIIVKTLDKDRKLTNNPSSVANKIKLNNLNKEIDIPEDNNVASFIKRVRGRDADKLRSELSFEVTGLDSNGYLVDGDKLYKPEIKVDPKGIEPTEITFTEKPIWTENSDYANDPDYVAVTFAQGDHGKITEKKTYYVLKGIEMYSVLKAPNVETNTGWDFVNWNPELDKKYDQAIEHVAQYNYSGDDVVAQNPGEDKPDVPENFVLVEFKEGEHGTLEGTTKYWVNPEKTVTVTAPTVHPVKGFTFTGWDKSLTQKFTDKTEITAEYTKKEDFRCLTKDALKNQFENAADGLFSKINSKEGVYIGSYDKATRTVEVAIIDKTKGIGEISGTGLIANLWNLKDNNYLYSFKIGSQDERVITPTMTMSDIKTLVILDMGNALNKENLKGLEDFIGQSITLQVKVKQPACDNAVTIDYTIKGKEAISSILKDKLDPKDIIVWKDTPVDEINWKDGVKLNEANKDNEEYKTYLNDATVEEATDPARKTDTVGNIPGKVKVTFSDGSSLIIDKQNLIVNENLLPENDPNAPKDAIEVKFYLSEGVKVVKEGVTTEGNKDNPVLYRTFKMKLGTDLSSYKHTQLNDTIFNLINAEPNNGYSAPVTWKGNIASNPKNYVVSKDNNEFTANAEKTGDIIVDDTPDTDDDKPAGYVTVKFLPGDNGSLEGATKFYVKPNAGKTNADLTEPTVKANTGYKVADPKWDPKFVEGTKIEADATYTAQYTKLDDVIKGHDDKGNEVEKPEGYVAVRFLVDKNGTLEGETVFYVNPEAKKTMKDIKPPTIKVKDEYVAKGYKVGDPMWEPDLTNDTTLITADRYYVANFDCDHPVPTEFEINYISTDATMGTVSPASETVAIDGGTITGSTATAKEDYKFVKWIDTEGKQVSDKARFVPTKREAATYIAVFEKIEKPAPNPNPNPNPKPDPKPSDDSPSRETDRTKGKDRVETAIEISKKYFGQADTVIVVDSKDFPDAMTASVLSKLLKAPILLTDTNKLDSRVAEEINRLGAKDVIIVGGNKSVSEAVKKELAKFDKDNVERIYGKDRYETSAQVARRVVGITGKLGHAVVASGEVFADALTVAPYASREGYPILLVKYNSLPPTVNKAIKDLAITKVTIAGGYSTVSKPLEKLLPTVAERLRGDTRYETAIDIANKKFSSSKETFLANGEQWMDALVIGPVGGILDMPILLTPANSAPKSLKDYIAKANIEKITAIGGRSMVSDRVLNELSK